jgi:hypothetical protein
MKLQITIFAFILLGFNSAISQNNNLQFSNAIMGQITGIPINGIAGTIVVPAGKIWKIESRSLSNISGTYPTTINQGSMTVYIGNFLAYSNNYDAQTLALPIWMPAGTYSITFNVANYNDQNHSFNYSVIEFNAVP